MGEPREEPISHARKHQALSPNGGNETDGQRLKKSTLDLRVYECAVVRLCGQRSSELVNQLVDPTVLIIDK